MCAAANRDEAKSPRLAIILREFLESCFALVREEPFPPDPYPPTSHAAQDAKATDDEAVGTLLSYCHPLEESAAHHAWSITRGLEEPLLTFSLFTDCRAILECCATGVWLLDSQVDSHERIRRSLVLRYRNVQEQEKLAQSYGGKADAEKARKQVLKIVQRAKDLDLPTTAGDRPGIGGYSPGKTELARDVFKAEQVYRVLSGAAHGQASYLRQLGMKEVDGDPRVHTVHLPEVALQLVTISPVTWIYQLSRALREYKGLSTEAYQRVHYETFLKIKTATP